MSYTIGDAIDYYQDIVRRAVITTETNDRILISLANSQVRNLMDIDLHQEKGPSWLRHPEQSLPEIVKEIFPYKSAAFQPHDKKDEIDHPGLYTPLTRNNGYDPVQGWGSRKKNPLVFAAWNHFNMDYHLKKGIQRAYQSLDIKETIIQITKTIRQQVHNDPKMIEQIGRKLLGIPEPIFSTIPHTINNEKEEQQERT